MREENGYGATALRAAVAGSSCGIGCGGINTNAGESDDSGTGKERDAKEASLACQEEKTALQLPEPFRAIAASGSSQQRTYAAKWRE